MNQLDWAQLRGLLTPPEYLYLQLLTEAGRRGLLALVRLELQAAFGGRHARELHADELKWLNGRMLALLRRQGGVRWPR